MFLKNYTSDVAASITIGRIQNILLKAGVKTIEMDYGPGQKVVAVTFRIEIDAFGRTLAIRMPADVAGAQQALWLDYVGTDKLEADGESTRYPSQKKKHRADFLEQGERTAWKIVQDWIEIQLSMIQLKQADPVQVFLPYVWDGRQSFYTRLKENNFKALMPPATAKEEPRPVILVP